MKKILSAIASATILALAVGLMPSVSSAIETPPECCELRAPIDLGGTEGGADAAICIKGAHAGYPGTICQQDNATPDCPRKNWGMYCVMNTLTSVVDWIFVILVALAAILIIFGAFMILTSGGSPEKVTSGRNYILYAAVGLLVAFLAKAVPGVVRMVSGF